MTIHIKICGVTDRGAVEAAVTAGADAIGFVFAESPRQVTPEQATAFSVDLPPRVARVAVFLRPTILEVMRVLAGFDADVVQADHFALTGLPAPIDSLPVYREGETAALHSLLAQKPLAQKLLSGPGRPRLLYEGSRSGVGRSVDWSRAAEFAPYTRMSLAGGLDPDNVASAIRAVRPFGVDVSSGVESAPGVKDTARIRDFISAVRSVDVRRVGA